MARPRKTGLEYFALDVDILQDLKIRKLLKRRSGARALGIFVSLLCQIYKEGYYLDYNEDTLFVIADDMDEDEQFVSNVIEYCMEVGLFDKTTFDEYGVLTSHGIQERYVMAQRLCKRCYSIDKYNLLQKESSTDVSSPKTKVSSEETAVISEETNEVYNLPDRNTVLTGVSSEISTQKEIKEKKKKEKIITPTSATHACEDFLEGSHREGLDSEIEELKQDSEWIRITSQHIGVNHEELLEYLNLFKDNCICRGKIRHDNPEDLKKHFMDWMRIQFENQQTIKTKGNGYLRKEKQISTADLRRPSPVPVGARQKDFTGTF